MRVWQAMQPVDKVLKLTDIMDKARRIFRTTNARIIPVVDENGKYAGYLRRKDVIKITSLSLVQPITGQRTKPIVRDFVNEHPILTPNMSIFEATEKLREFDVYAAPVLESLDNPRVIGVISIADIIKALVAAGYKPIAETVSEVISKDYVAVKPDERIDKVWHKMVDENIPAVLVISEKGSLQGILTIKDLIDKRAWMFARESERGGRTPGKVKRFMTRGVVTVSPDLPIEMVAKFLVDYDFRLLPVVDDEGNVIGVITQDDVLRAYIQGKKPEAIKVPPRVITVEEAEIQYATTGNQLQSVLVTKAVSPRIEKAPTVGEIADFSPVVVGVNDSIERARNLMLRYKVSYLLVVDKEDNIVGILSKRNMIRAIGIRGAIWRRKADELQFIPQIMTPHSPEISEDTTIEEAASMMLFYNTDALLVKKNDGSIGLLTKDDIVRVYADMAVGRAKVENLMQPRKIGVVGRHQSIAAVVRLMENNYLDAVVVQENNAPIGIISVNRLVFVAISDPLGGVRHRRVVWIRKLEHATKPKARYVKITPLVAEDFMIDVPETVTPDMDSAEVAKLMLDYDVDGLPVVDKDGVLVGIITKSDIIRELARTGYAEEEEIREKLKIGIRESQ